jgi:hypothetical protein
VGNVKDRARGRVDRVKNWSGKCKGSRRGGETNDCLKRKVFLKNQKHEPNIVEITHLCIMHRQRTQRVHAMYMKQKREIHNKIISSVPSSILSSMQKNQIYILKREKTRKKIKTEKHFNN